MGLIYELCTYGDTRNSCDICPFELDGSDNGKPHVIFIKNGEDDVFWVSTSRKVRDELSVDDLFDL